MITLFFFILYFVIGIPVARRTAWWLQNYNTFTVLPREQSKAPYYGIEVTNSKAYLPEQLCNNCGGHRDYHPGGTMAHYRSYSRENYTCSTFEKWDGEKNYWPGAIVTYGWNPILATVTALVVVLPLWPFVLAGYAIVKVTPHVLHHTGRAGRAAGTRFAKAPRGWNA